MKKKLIELYKMLVLPLLFIFSLSLLYFTTLTFVRTWMLNPQQPSLTSEAVDVIIGLSAIFTLIILPMLVLVLAVTYPLLNWSPLLGKKIARQTSLETAYNLKSILGFTSIPLAMIAVTFLILMYSVSVFYGLGVIAFIFAFMLVASIWEGILDKKEETIFLLRKFSEDVKASLEKTKSSLPSSIKFAKGLKTFDKTLPRASHIPSIDRRLTQVEIILSLGDKKDLSVLSDHVLAISQAMERDYLEGFDEEYRNLTEFLDTFENAKKSVIELAKEVTLREKIKKQSGETMREILVKTIPILIAILFSVLIYMLLGIKIELPS